MKDTLVIYHSADLDGICSREIARKALGDSANYIGLDYGQPDPDLSGYAKVYIIDIRLSKETMAAHRDKIIWIDHHKSAIEDLAELDLHGYRIDGVAACRLAWQWFFGGLVEKQLFVDRAVIEPYAVQLLGEFDVWDKRNPDTDLFQLGMQAEKAPRWHDLFEPEREWKSPRRRSYLQNVMEAGRAIQSYTEVTNAQISTERGFDVTFEGLFFRALNIARCNSLTFTAALRPEHDGCLAYFWNGKKWRFSLYHAKGKEHHDLSQIAVKFGGGGHRGACGFELQALPVELGGVSFLAMTTGLGQGPS